MYKESPFSNCFICFLLFYFYWNWLIRFGIYIHGYVCFERGWGFSQFKSSYYNILNQQTHMHCHFLLLAQSISQKRSVLILPQNEMFDWFKVVMLSLWFPTVMMWCPEKALGYRQYMNMMSSTVLKHRPLYIGAFKCVWDLFSK